VRRNHRETIARATDSPSRWPFPANAFQTDSDPSPACTSRASRARRPVSSTTRVRVHARRHRPRTRITRAATAHRARELEPADAFAFVPVDRVRDARDAVDARDARSKRSKRMMRVDASIGAPCGRVRATDARAEVRKGRGWEKARLFRFVPLCTRGSGRDG